MEYVSGLRGVAPETREPIKLMVKGTMPSWLHGAVYRNGPGTFDIERKNGTVFTFRHWFDGLTMLHKFEMYNGSVTYCSRHLNPGQQQYIAQGGDAGQGFAQDPCNSIFARVFTALTGCGGPKDPVTGRRANPNVGVTVGMLQGKLVSRTDVNVLVEVIPDDLTPKPAFTYTDINPAFKGFLSAAHPQYDRNTGETFNFTLEFPKGKGQYNVFCIPEDPNSNGWLLASIKALPAYIHSMAMTEKYVILMVWPALTKPLGMMMGQSSLTAMHWEGTEGVSYYVLDRTKRGDAHVATYTLKAFFCFHNINAYEDGDDVIIDLLAYEDNSVLYDLELSKLRDEHKVKGLSSKPPYLHRIVLPRVSTAVKAGPDAKQQAAVQCMTKELELELPRMHPAWQCKEYTWMYAVAMKTGESLWMDRIAKVNVNTGAMRVWREPGCFVGEPLFVPTPGGTAEDDGVLLVVALDGKQQRSFLAVLDAKTTKEIARAEVPSVVPFGFHGNFISSQGEVVTETN